MHQHNYSHLRIDWLGIQYMDLLHPLKQNHINKLYMKYSLLVMSSTLVHSWYIVYSLPKSTYPPDNTYTMYYQHLKSYQLDKRHTMLIQVQMNIDQLYKVYMNYYYLLSKYLLNKPHTVHLDPMNIDPLDMPECKLHYLQFDHPDNEYNNLQILLLGGEDKQCIHCIFLM